MKAIILARVSTKEQEETGLSIKKIQLPQMRDYAKDNGFEIIEEFVFQETASQKLRKKFNDMIKFVKDHDDIKIIIGFRVDRLTRNFRDAVEMDLLRSEYDKELHFVNDRLVLKKDSFGKAITEWDMKVFLAKQHINRCQEDTYNTIISKLKSGEQYGQAPYGYENYRDETGKAIVEIDDLKAGIVKKVFNMYTTGAESYLSIARKLDKNYPNLKINKRTVERILTNQYYFGMREYKGTMYPHKYEKLITEDTFKLATDIRENRTKTKKKGKMLGKTGIYRGLIYCAECGCAYSPSLNRHKKLGRNVQSESYYYCTNAKKVHKEKPKGTNDQELSKQFAELFKKMQIPKKDLDWMVKTLREAHEGKVEFNQVTIKEIRKQRDLLTKRIDKGYEDMLDERITRDKYDELRNKWTNERDMLNKKLGQIDDADKEYYITSSYLLELASRSYELFLGSEPEQKRQIITLTLQNLEIKNGKIQYTWHKPFDRIFECSWVAPSANRHTWGS